MAGVEGLGGLHIFAMPPMRRISDNLLAKRACHIGWNVGGIGPVLALGMFAAANRARDGAALGQASDGKVEMGFHSVAPFIARI